MHESPPPLYLPVLPVIVHFVMVGQLLLQKMPPPASASPLVIVKPARIEFASSEL